MSSATSYIFTNAVPKRPVFPKSFLQGLWTYFHVTLKRHFLRGIYIRWISVAWMTYFAGKCFLFNLHLKRMKFRLTVKPSSSVCLTLSWRRPLSYRNQSIDLLSKSMDWFLYDSSLRHERVKTISFLITTKSAENLKLLWFETWHTSFPWFYFILLFYLIPQ